MTRYPQFHNLTGLSAWQITGGTAGTNIPVVLDSTNGVGLTLGANNYTFVLGGERYGAGVKTVVHSFSAVWPSGIGGTLTIEGTNFPKTITGADQGAKDISDWDVTAAWQLVNPTL